MPRLLYFLFATFIKTFNHLPMKTDRYIKIILTIIAACLLVNVLEKINLIPQAYAADTTTKAPDLPADTVPQYGLVPLNPDGSINVKFSNNNPMEVKIVGISTYDELPVNIDEINGNSIFNGVIPVKIKE